MLLHHKSERSVRLRYFKAAGVRFLPGFDNYRTSVGVAYMNLIELVVEGLSVVHLAVKTARKQASYTEPAFEMPRPSTLRAVERLPMRSDRN